MKKVSINQFRHYITFQSKDVGGTDDYGQRSTSWEEVRSLWAKHEVKSGGEVTDGNRRVQITKHVFTIRSVPNINPTMRILYRGSYYTIDSIYDKEGEGKYLNIDATLDNSKTESGSVV